MPKKTSFLEILKYNKHSGRLIFVLTNVQLRSIFEEHKLGSVWKHLRFSKKFNFWAFSMHLPHTPSYLYVSSYFFSWELFLPVALFPQVINFSCQTFLISVWLIFNTMFSTWKLITPVLLTSGILWIRHKPRRYLAIHSFFYENNFIRTRASYFTKS